METLNQCFVSVAPTRSAKLNANHKSPKFNRNENKYVLQQTEPQEVAKILENLKNKKNSGPDGFSNEILKCCNPVIESFIASAFNQCTLERAYPADFKIDKATLLHKKGDKSNLENYRPISLLNYLGKVFEKFLQKIMMKVCVKNKLLSSAQYGFRPKISCIDVINQVTDYMRAKIDHKNTGRACELASQI